MHRFFLDSDLNDNLQIAFTEEISSQITRVFRMREGDQIIVFNGKFSKNFIKDINVQ